MCERGETHFAAAHEQFASALTDSLWSTSYALLAALLLASLPALNRCSPAIKIAVTLSVAVVLSALLSYSIPAEVTWAPSGSAFWVSLLLLVLPLSLALLPAASSAKPPELLVAVVIIFVSLAGISSVSPLSGWSAEVRLRWIATAIYAVVGILIAVHLLTGKHRRAGPIELLRSGINGSE